MRKLALTVLVASLVAALPRASRASVFSTMDGSGLGEGTQAVQTWLGLPNLGVLYMQGQPGDFDFGYGLSVDYLKGTAQPVFHIRWSFINADEYNLALTTDFGLWLDSGLTYAEPNNVPNTGLRLTPGIALGMRPHPSYTTFFTVEIPFLWSWGYGGGRGGAGARGPRPRVRHDPGHEHRGLREDRPALRDRRRLGRRGVVPGRGVAGARVPVVLRRVGAAARPALQIPFRANG